jgi:hypothetical protein
MATDNRLLLSMPIGLFANGDGANNCHEAKGPPGDQIGYGIKLFTPQKQRRYTSSVKGYKGQLIQYRSRGILGCIIWLCAT